MNSWTLEIAKLIVGILTPLSVVALGWLINQKLKKLDFVQWSNQKLVEKRLSLYDEVAPLLNKLFCFYTWKGYWKEVSPDDVLHAKRSLDKTINIYRYILGEKFYAEYQEFIRLLFQTYTGFGRDAMIRSEILSGLGDRKKHCSYTWDERWTDHFTGEGSSTLRQGVADQYYKLMNVLKDSIGIQEAGSDRGLPATHRELPPDTRS
jgi:hypothetical protein